MLYPFAIPFCRNAKTKVNKNTACPPKNELLLISYYKEEYTSSIIIRKLSFHFYFVCMTLFRET